MHLVSFYRNIAGPENIPGWLTHITTIHTNKPDRSLGTRLSHDFFNSTSIIRCESALCALGHVIE
ncbi:hypothetical protein ccbrp13_50480 [Ktedonobacteria bacterium brp13]|nr:hypothetical protein ccbrp13_50480 [Ktedonobacteria bacterium brp13]